MNPITLAEAGRQSVPAMPVSPATVRIIPTVAPAVAPTVAPPQPTAIPTPGASSGAAYFGLFRACDCGHSSAWHHGAFGDAWRAGQQVRGGCEAGAEDGTARGCSCARFRDRDIAGQL